MNMSPPFSSLKQALADWQDPDVAAYLLGQCLGIIGLEVSFGASKPLVCTAHPVAEVLYQTLHRLVAVKVLEYEQEGMRYRWNSAFDLGEGTIAQQRCEVGSAPGLKP